MSTFAKIMVVVNFVLAFAFLAAAGTLHGAAEDWKGRYGRETERLGQEVSALNSQLKARQDEVDAARQQAASYQARAEASEAVGKQQAESNAALHRELEAKNGEIAKLTSAVTDNSNAIQAQTARNEQLTNQLAQKDADLKTAQERVTTLEENLARETGRADDAEKNLATAEKRNTELTESSDALTTQLKVYQSKFGSIPETAVVAAVNGVVQAASPRDDVYVLSVGSKDGVKVGYEFTVSRGDRYISTIVIDSVFPNHSAGHTKQGMRKAEVQPGDRASTAPGL